MQGNKARQEITPQSNSKTAEGQSAATAKKSGNSSALKDTNRNKTLKRKSTNSGKKGKVNAFNPPFLQTMTMAFLISFS